MDSIINEVKLSYGRALGDREMFDKFYQRFINSHPSIAEKFRNTDMAQQKDALKKTISMAILFPQNNVVAKRTMEKVKKSHGRDRLNIKPQQYQYWMDSLIDTLKDCDHYFDADLEKKWRNVLTKSITYMRNK